MQLYFEPPMDLQVSRKKAPASSALGPCGGCNFPKVERRSFWTSQLGVVISLGAPLAQSRSYSYTLGLTVGTIYVLGAVIYDSMQYYVMKSGVSRRRASMLKTLRQCVRRIVRSRPSCFVPTSQQVWQLLNLKLKSNS